MIDRGFLRILALVGLILLSIQILFAFSDRAGMQDGQWPRSALPTLLMEWALYMLLFVILSMIVVRTLRWTCSSC